MTSTSSWTTSTGAIGPCVGPSLARCISCSRRHYGAARGAVTLVGNRVGARMESALVDEMVAVSSATAIGNGLDVDDVTIIGNPVAQSHLDTTEMARVRRLPERFVLFVGDLRPMKGIDVLFDAHRRLWSDRPHQPPLVVIGKRWPDTPTDIPDGVHVFERWPNAAVLAAWERALIGVVPSVWEEPFGIVAVEALRAGTPVVASRVGGLPEIVRDGVDGLLVPRSDAIALADAVASLVDDEPRRRAMSAAARARARDFDMGVIVDDVAALYQRPPERR